MAFSPQELSYKLSLSLLYLNELFGGICTKKYYFEHLEKITNYVGPKLKASPGNKLKGIWMFTRPYYFDPPISLAAWVYEAQKFSQRNSSQIKSIFMHFFNLHYTILSPAFTYYAVTVYTILPLTYVQAIKHSFFYTNYLTKYLCFLEYDFSDALHLFPRPHCPEIWTGQNRSQFFDMWC